MEKTWRKILLTNDMGTQTITDRVIDYSCLRKEKVRLFICQNKVIKMLPKDLLLFRRIPREEKFESFGQISIIKFRIYRFYPQVVLYIIYLIWVSISA